MVRSDAMRAPRSSTWKGESREKASVVKVVVPLVVMGGLGVALADKLSDFKNAASNDGCEGCESIPYSSPKRI